MVPSARASSQPLPRILPQCTGPDTKRYYAPYFDVMQFSFFATSKQTRGEIGFVAAPVWFSVRLSDVV